MSNNISVPASFVGDNLEQAGTFGQSYYYTPGRFTQNFQNPGSVLSSNQSYHTAFLSPHNLPQNYGSIAPNVHHSNLDPISGSLTENGDFLGTSFTSNSHSAMWRNSVEGYKKRQMKMKIPESAPLDSKYVSNNDFFFFFFFF